MTKRFFKLYFICFLAAAFFSGCGTGTEPHLQGNVYPVGAGFGYTISAGKKLLIKQTVIPAINGNHVFCDTADAQKICDLVLQKLQAHKSPYVSKEELTALKIKTKC
ncbi:DUF4907 domain-containing protein [Flavobacterium psychrotrophum]|uniref:DUF4907 domain-containing protein n=1 Tax=Flavobacterium psychrotrophum TaxID=2294119 RepID=UPI000E319172|nr:DUF4907 domain-containing protein [Flavobacterium psychrotrophum]